MKSFTAPEVRIRLKKRQAGRSLREWSKEVGVCHSYLHDVVKGRREPGPSILDYLGLEPEVSVTYQLKKEVQR